MKNLKTFIAYFVICAVLAAVMLPTLSVFAATKKKYSSRYWKAQTIDEEEEEADAECPPEECGAEEEEEVAPVCTKDTWTCGSWNACSASGSQTRSCKISVDCKTASTASPATSQKCTPPVDTTKQAEEDAAAKKAADDAAAKKAAEEAAAKKAAEDAAAKKAEQAKKAEEAKKKTATEEVKKPEEDTTTKQAEADTAAKKAAEDAAAKKALDEAAAKIEAEKQRAAGEETAKLQAEKDAAKLKVEEEARLKAEEEAKLKAEEELRKAAEESARMKAEADLLARAERERQKQEELRKAQEIQAFQQIIQQAPPAPPPPPPLVTDVNGNGIPDSVEAAAGLNAKAVDEKLIQIQADLAVQERKLVEEGGKSETEAKAQVAQEFKKKKVERKVEVIREVAKKKHRIEIASASQDTNGDGVSDEAEIVLGLNPKEKTVTTDSFTPAEQKLYGVDTKKDSQAAEKRCSTSVASGAQFSSDGFTVLAACPKNKSFTLVAVDQSGRELTLETKTASDNNKMIFAVDKKLPPGKYLFQVRPVKQQANFPTFAWFASTLNNESDNAQTASSPVVVNVVSTVDVPKPDVKTIGNVELASGIRDVKVTPTSDGKIRVTGLTDITTMVVGTFSSAVFTSAILADVETGSFEVVSPRPLEQGGHEVVVYATRPEDALQSSPVKMAFSIVESQKGSDTAMVLSTRNAAEEKKFPVLPVVLGGAAVLLIGIGIFLKKNKSA